MKGKYQGRILVIPLLSFIVVFLCTFILDIYESLAPRRGLIYVGLKLACSTAVPASEPFPDCKRGSKKDIVWVIIKVLSRISVCCLLEDVD